MSGIEAVITYHLEIPVRDLLDEQGIKSMIGTVLRIKELSLWRL